MKKFICICLCAVFVLTLAACGKKKEEGPLVAYRDDEGNIVTGYATTTKQNKKDNGKKDINEEVEITMPLVFVGEEYKNDLESYCKTNGFISCKLNKKDQTVEIKMNSLTYDLNLTRIGTQIMRNIGNMIDSGEYPYAKKLESYSDNFDEIILLVDGEGYNADNQASLLPYSLGEYGMFYQVYTTENKYKCTVKIKDEKSGEIIFEKTYKSDNKGTEY